MREIGLFELRRHWFEIIQAVTSGESFLVTRDGVPLAHLTPYRPPNVAASLAEVQDAAVDPEIVQVVTQLASWFGDDVLAAALGVSPAVILHASQRGTLYTTVLPRLDYLTDLADIVFRQTTPRRARDWLRKSRRDFRGRSALMVIRGAWTPEDEAPQLLLALARAEFPGRSRSSS